MPLLNWEKCLEGKFYFIRKEKASEYDKEDVEAFYSLYNKYLNKYGLSQDLIDYMEAQVHFIELVAAYAEQKNPNKSILNQIAVAEGRLKDLNPMNHKGMTIGQVITQLSKWMGQWINKRQITVEDFKDLIQEYERENKKG
jgi:hypothetical protein